MPRLDDILDLIAKGLTGTKPEPAPEPDPQIILDHIAEVSKNARTTWFGLLGLLAFVGVTLVAHNDADFFAYGAETQLPLIGIKVPVKAFFIFAPVLVAALYTYLHLYLLNLWDALADAPAKIDGQPLGDRVFPWLITHAALWQRDRIRKDGSTSPRPMGRFVVIVSLALGAAFGILVLALLWFRSMPAHNQWLTLWIAVWFFLATLVGLTGLASAAKRMANVSRAEVSRSHGVRRGWSVAFALTLVFLSWETTEGGILTDTKTGQPILLYPADLREAVLVAKPDDWQPYDRWLKDFGKTYRKENGIEPKDELTPEQRRAFWAEARDEWSARLASLTGPELRQRDLRNADMTRAILPRADLRGARLDGANLKEAELQGAELDCWEPSDDESHCTSLQGADLREAQMQGADLGGAKMQGAVLRGAQMQGADLSFAKMQGANLRRAQMQGANLLGAQMQGAYLGGAQMQGAVLHEAKMQGADLSRAKMQGANLSWAQMQGAVLFSAKMQGADLGSAQMQGAELGKAQMQGADLSFAKMQGAALGWAQMQGANLRDAQMRGAALIGAQMQGADLIGAQMQGADLSRAEMQDADCSSATLRGALLQSAILTCKENTLMQEQLELAVGDFRTVLPEGLTVASCLETLPRDVEAALAHHPEQGDDFRRSRAQIRDALLCDRDEDGNLTEPPRLFTGTWLAREDGSWIDKVTGRVSGPWVEQPDGTWVDKAEQPD